MIILKVGRDNAKRRHAALTPSGVLLGLLMLVSAITPACGTDSSATETTTGPSGSGTSNLTSACTIDIISSVDAYNTDWGSGRMSLQLQVDLAACLAATDIHLVSAQLDGQSLAVDYEFMCGCDLQTGVCAQPTAQHCSSGSFYGVVFIGEGATNGRRLDLVLDVQGVSRSISVGNEPGANQLSLVEICPGRDKASCVACTPTCGNWVCGDNGCGGTCGTCPSGTTCYDGQCVTQSTCAPECLRGAVCCGFPFCSGDCVGSPCC